MPTTVEIIARRLYDAGCRHAFGIPGGEVLAMMDALDAAGIKFSLVKHENAAGFMAEGVHHADGAPGILLATIGPGLANAVNVIANAEQDRVPVIVLSGCVDANEALTYTHQVMDHNALMAPVTKASFVAVDGAVDAVIDKALAIALEGRPGPVHIDIPISLATRAQAASAGARATKMALTAPAPGPDLDTARQKFNASQRPAIIAGLDVLSESGAAESIVRFAERFKIPVLTTYKAKGVLAEDHPLSLGGHGLSPLSDALVLPFLDQSDLVIAVGYDPIEMRSAWRAPWPSSKAIEFAAAPNRHFVHHADLSFQCGITAGLDALADGLDSDDRTTSWPGGEPSKLRAGLAELFEPGDQWGPASAMHAIRRAAPRDTVVTIDSGAHRILLSQIWPCYAPRTMLQSTGLCTMGCALPLATGYKLARPDTPVIAFMGDAGLEMILGELATLRDAKFPVLVVVFVDQSLALIELKQRQNQMSNLGVDFPRTDFSSIANAMGGVGCIASTTQDVEREVQAAFTRDTYTLLEIPIERKSYDNRF